MANPPMLSLGRPGGGERPMMLEPNWVMTGSGAGEGASAKLRNLCRSFMRRSRLVIVTVLMLNGLALLAVNHLTPRYTAEADLIVGPQQEQVVDLKAVLSGLTGDSDVIESEIQVLRSRDIARSIVQRFHLDHRAEFNPALRPPGPVAIAKAFVADQAAALMQAVQPLLHRVWHGHAGLLTTLPAPPPAADPADALIGPLVSPRDPLSVPVDSFLQSLDVAGKGRSRVIGVSFTSQSPVLAAGLANAVADAYIANQLRAKTDATTQAHVWLDQRVTELREQMVAADDAVVAYQRRMGLTRGQTASLITEQMSALGRDVIHAEDEVATAQARLAGASTIDPNEFQMRQQLLAAQTNERRLETNLARLRGQSATGNQSEIEMRALQQDADADRALYDRVLERAKETQIQSGLQQPDAKIVSGAEWPQEASFPKKSIILPGVFVASCLVAALLALAVEGLDRGFLTVEQLEATLGLPSLGVMPLLKRRETKRRSPERYILDAPNTPYGEAIRSLHTSLMLANTKHVPKVILMTSALPGEGKTAISLSMARMMASCGKRVVIVDCDLRRPMLHKAFNAPRGPGLVEVLTGKATLIDVLRKDPLSGANLVSAGALGNTAPDLFASVEMYKLVNVLCNSYDLVLLDCAPVLAISDSRHLCRLADETVFVVRWQDTRCHAAAAALRQVVTAGGKIGGVLLSMVDLDQYGRYSPLGITQRKTGLYLEQ